MPHFCCHHKCCKHSKYCRDSKCVLDESDTETSSTSSSTSKFPVKTYYRKQKFCYKCGNTVESSESSDTIHSFKKKTRDYSEDTEDKCSLQYSQNLDDHSQRCSNEDCAECGVKSNMKDSKDYYCSYHQQTSSPNNPYNENVNNYDKLPQQAPGFYPFMGWNVVLVPMLVPMYPYPPFYYMPPRNYFYPPPNPVNNETPSLNKEDNNSSDGLEISTPDLPKDMENYNKMENFRSEMDEFLNKKTSIPIIPNQHESLTNEDVGYISGQLDVEDEECCPFIQN